MYIRKPGFLMPGHIYNRYLRIFTHKCMLSLLLQEGKVKLRNKDVIQAMLLLSNKGQWFLFMLTIYQNFLCH